MYAFTAIALALVVIYRRPLMESMVIFLRLGPYPLFTSAVFALGVVALIVPSFFGNSLPVPLAYLYASVLLALQSYRIIKKIRVSECRLSLSVIWLVIASLLVILTPLADMVLQRDYPHKIGVWVGALSLGHVGLYMVEVSMGRPRKA